MRRLAETNSADLKPDQEIATFSGSRASPEDVIMAVDDLLRAFGLEIVQHASDRPDLYAISIDRRADETSAMR